VQSIRSGAVNAAGQLRSEKSPAVANANGAWHDGSVVESVGGLYTPLLIALIAPALATPIPTGTASNDLIVNFDFSSETPPPPYSRASRAKE